MKSESDLRKEALGSVEMWEDLDMKSENRGGGWVGGCVFDGEGENGGMGAEFWRKGGSGVSFFNHNTLGIESQSYLRINKANSYETFRCAGSDFIVAFILNIFFQLFCVGLLYLTKI